MLETIKKILDTAVCAPSGDNLQPWQFGIDKDQLYIFNVPEKDQSLFNFRQLGSYVGHGALIENIVIGAPQSGLKTNVNLFPNDIEDLVATINFTANPSAKDELYEYISKRSTNRKPYKDQPLNSGEHSELLTPIRELGFGEIKLVEDKGKKFELAQILAINERMIMENKSVHDFLFQHIVWTQEEELEKRSGLYVKTLEISPSQEKGFKMAGNWVFVQFLNKFGFSKKFASQNVNLYNSSAAIGAIVMPDNSNASFVLAGRAMQRLWLKATKLGLSIQPITAVLFLKQRVLGGATNELSSSQIDLIEKGYKRMSELFEISSKTICMVFRIGQADKPTANSSRLPPSILSEEKLKQTLATQ